ncbi:hypothetical protein [Segetibacter koreensis]|uniref:hypothetical protein n=1 Tax=Segetibacter koreensis TaxID=398037 RepID=UPI0012F74E62|nr:hypothetical protein [Segetibacter koreensis]
MKSFKKTWFSIALVTALAAATSCDTPSYVEGGVHYVNPPWAPAYYPGVRYYYLPDIEVYYDLSRQQFVYFGNGQWIFSPALPSIYAGYDLFNGFVVALNFRVFQPWMRHHYYVYHYPHYYYRNYYRRMDLEALRGFNENNRKNLFWKPGYQERRNDRWENKTGTKPPITRPPRNINLNQKQVDQPAKVTSPIREYKPIKRPERQ